MSREKVIKGLEAILEETADMFYRSNIQDALTLLKAQEPVKPYTKRDGRTTFFLCGGCSEPLCIAKDSYKPKYCPNCGRAVKWE